MKYLSKLFIFSALFFSIQGFSQESSSKNSCDFMVTGKSKRNESFEMELSSGTATKIVGKYEIAIVNFNNTIAALVIRDSESTMVLRAQSPVNPGQNLSLSASFPGQELYLDCSIKTIQ
ncbi:MAG: hypothetical protein ACXWRE_04760 [Pseudobdellovibrionaceae bacterium]